MNKLTKSIIIAASAFAVSSASAANISFNLTGFSSFTNSDAITFVANGNAAWVGSFDTGFDVAANATDFAELSANFGHFDSAGAFQSSNIVTTVVTDFGGVGPGSVSASNAATPDANGTTPDVYLWVFNNAVAGSAAEYGLWNMGALATGIAPLGTSQSLAFTPVTAIHGTLGGSLAAVPEPSTFAALAGLCALGAVMVRRRRA